MQLPGAANVRCSSSMN
ncbi:MAG: hypothetical protein K2L99_07335 [Muribaculaceae bacterium]|nr:hypothetical protein [Muribaculaceae bacterium]